jgi:hypothetical protein
MARCKAGYDDCSIAIHNIFPSGSADLGAPDVDRHDHEQRIARGPERYSTRPHGAVRKETPTMMKEAALAV